MMIAQISDPHIRPAGELYKGLIDSNRMLKNAVDHLNALKPRPELVLVSGDLVAKGRQIDPLGAANSLSVYSGKSRRAKRLQPRVRRPFLVTEGRRRFALCDRGLPGQDRCARQYRPGGASRAGA